MTAAEGGFLGTEISVILPVEPMPKLRPRFRVVHGRVFTHTPYETKAFENEVAALYLMREGLKFEAHEPLQVKIEFYLQHPKSFTKKKIQAIEDGLFKHTVKPDLDNLTKALLDALNDIAWHDDAQIVDLQIRKEYTTGDGFINLCIRQLT